MTSHVRSALWTLLASVQFGGSTLVFGQNPIYSKEYIVFLEMTKTGPPEESFSLVHLLTSLEYGVVVCKTFPRNINGSLDCKNYCSHLFFSIMTFLRET